MTDRRNNKYEKFKDVGLVKNLLIAAAGSTNTADMVADSLSEFLTSYAIYEEYIIVPVF